MSEKMIDSFIRFLTDHVYSTQGTFETANIYKEVAKMPKDEVTKKVLIAMFCENTGCHVLDSGGDNGRGWQQSRLIQDWDSIPEVRWNGDFTRSAYKMLLQYLDYDMKLDKKFQEFANDEDHRHQGWLKSMEDFGVKVLHRKIYIENTYNHDSVLDKTLQFGFTEIYGDCDVIILQIHNGCDVRGGYSTPHVFRGSVEDIIHDNSDAFLRCSNEKCDFSTWSDDSGYHWYGNSTNETRKTEDFIPDTIEWTDENGKEHSIDFDSHTIVCPKCGSPFDIEGNQAFNIEGDKEIQHALKIVQAQKEQERKHAEIVKNNHKITEFFNLIDTIDKQLDKTVELVDDLHKKIFDQ